MSDLSGSWLGTYWQNGRPTRFEATLVQSGNQISGRIQDESYLGEAQMEGESIGRSIRFTKSYLGQSSTPILYVGTVTEDGNFMQGEWTFSADQSKRNTGPWEAHRGRDSFSAELTELRSRLSRQAPVGVS